MGIWYSDGAAELQDQVRHDAAAEADQQPKGARQRGCGRTRAQGTQLPHRCPDKTEEETGGKNHLENSFSAFLLLLTYVSMILICNGHLTSTIQNLTAKVTFR